MHLMLSKQFFKTIKSSIKTDNYNICYVNLIMHLIISRLTFNRKLNVRCFTVMSSTAFTLKKVKHKKNQGLMKDCIIQYEIECNYLFLNIYCQANNLVNTDFCFY